MTSLFNALKYIIRSASYGVFLAVVLLIFFPELRLSSVNSLSFLSNAPQAPAPLSYATAVKKAAPAVVNIYSQGISANSAYLSGGEQKRRLGSGVIMDSRGYILTNFHVVKDAGIIVVLLQTGETHSAELIGYDIHTDLAVLKVNAINLPVIPQHQALTSNTGDVVLAIGNPFNLGQTVTQGIISATGRNGLSNTSYLEFLQMDAAINDGNSGGALVNTNGVLVGINSHKFLNENQNIQGIFFAVPYQLAQKVMRKIIANGRVIRGWLGIEATSSFERNAKGIRVNNVKANGPAALAGVEANDVIYQINDMVITNIPQALDLVAETIPGTVLQFTILRNNKQVLLPIRIAEHTNRL